MFNQYNSFRKESAASTAVKTGAAAAAGAVGGALLKESLTKLLNGVNYTAGELVLKPAVETTKDVARGGIKLALGTIPVTALTAAYLASAITSPKAQAEVAEDMIINAVERESLATSMRDLEELKRANSLASTKLRVHDQFI